MKYVFMKHLKEVEAREADYARWWTEMKAFQSFKGELTNWNQIPAYIQGIYYGKRQVITTIAVPKSMRSQKQKMILEIVNMLRQKSIDLYENHVYMTRSGTDAFGIMKKVNNEYSLIFVRFQDEGNMINVEFIYNIFYGQKSLTNQDYDHMSKLKSKNRLRYFERETAGEVWDFIEKKDDYINQGCLFFFVQLYFAQS